MIIKKWNASANNNTGAWEPQSPKITYTDIVNNVASVDSNGAPNFVSIFNSGKLRESYLPDSVFGGMKLVGSLSIPTSVSNPFELKKLITGTVTTGYSVTSLDDLTSLNFPDDYSGNGQKYIGHYWVVSNSMGIFDTDTSSTEADWHTAVFDDGSAPADANTFDNFVSVEPGDWLVITGWDNTNETFKISIISNTYREASQSNPGIMSTSDKTKLDGIETNADVTDATNVVSSLVAANGISSANKTSIRSNLGVDAAGTDNSTDVSLAGTLDYLTISGQTITRNAIDLTTDVSGTLPLGSGGTGATNAGDARTALGVDPAGTDNSTDVTLNTSSYDYLSISGQQITLGQIDYSTDISNKPSIGNGVLTVSEGVGMTVTTTGGNFAANNTGNTTVEVKMEQPFIVSADAPASAYEVNNNLWFDI